MPHPFSFWGKTTGPLQLYSFLAILCSMKRPFRGLRHRGPQKRYDAVVTGAGIGGLFCANFLQRRGLSVLLVEQHYMVGGYCSTFRRKGYTFDAATHFYPLLGNSQTLTGKLLQELDIDIGWVKMDPVDTFHFPDGSRFDVPADLETYRAKLNAEFPHQRQAMDTFFQQVREAYMRGLLCYFRGYGEERLGPYRHLNLQEVLDRTFDDPKLKLLLTADCPHWGSPPSRTSFVFDSMLRLSYFLGNYYPVGGSQAFADELAQRFEENGGDLLMSSRVDQITVEKTRHGGPQASGVRVTTDRGALRGVREIAAQTVISNADYDATLDRLVGRRWVQPQALEAVRQMKPSFPCFLTHIGLRGVDTKALEASQGYYWNHWDFDRVGSDALCCKIFSPTLYEPRMAPDGGQIVILQKVQEIEYDAIEDWSVHKQEVEAYVLAQLDRVMPGILDQIVVKTSASAATSTRFTMNQRGSMLGWEMSPEQLGRGRPDIRGPIDGLWFVGHWTRPGGGITPVIVSAMQVADAVLTANRPMGGSFENVPADVLDDVRPLEATGRLDPEVGGRPL